MTFLSEIEFLRGGGLDETIKEGNSVFMNLIKNISTDGAISRINVRSINKITDLTNLPIKSIEIKSLDSNNLSKIKEIISLPGETDVTLSVNNNSIIHHYKLSSKRKIDQKILAELKNAGVSLKIQ